MQWLTSSQNPRIKGWASLKERKYRERSSTYLVEGVRAVNTYRDYGAVLEAVLFDPYGEHGEEREAIALACEALGTPIFAVSEDVLAHVADTEQPQGILAVAKMPQYNLQDCLAKLSRYPGTCADVMVLADGIRDPGNLGTLIRTADAVGASAVVVTEGSVDPFQPKVVRSTMGSLARIAVLRLRTQDLLMALSSTPALRMVAADAGDGRSVYDCDLTGPMLLAIGSEASGLSQAVLQCADVRATLPMPGGAESLNAGVAASVMLYESLRQRMTVQMPVV